MESAVIAAALTFAGASGTIYDFLIFLNIYLKINFKINLPSSPVEQYIGRLETPSPEDV